MPSKNKGNRGELLICKILRRRFPGITFTRSPDSGARTGGTNREKMKNLPWEAKITFVSDIIVPANFEFVIESKFYEQISFWELLSDKSNWNKWIKQVEEDAKFVEREPLLIIKYNMHKHIVLIRACFTKIKKKDILLTWNGYVVLEFEKMLEYEDDFWFRKE